MATVTAGPAPRADERLGRTSPMKRLLGRPELGAVAGTLLVFLFFGAVARGTGMFTALGVVTFLEIAAQLGIIAVAAALLMIGGEFDLSVGSMIGFAGVTLAVPAIVWGWPLWLCILAAFAVAVAVGYANGLLVTRTGLPSFIVTLAGLFILRGLTIGLTRLITGRTQVSGLKPLVAEDPLAPLFAGRVFTGAFQWLATQGWITARPDGLPQVQGLPVSIVWWVGLSLVATWILLRTRLGNWIFAVGGDQNAARNVGVPVQRVKVSLFVITSSAAALVGIMIALRLGSIQAGQGIGEEFTYIIAAVVGGCLLTGGYGSAVGASLGALIVGMAFIGIQFSGWNTDWRFLFLGVILLMAVLVNNLVRKSAEGARK